MHYNYLSVYAHEIDQKISWQLVVNLIYFKAFKLKNQKSRKAPVAQVDRAAVS